MAPGCVGVPEKRPSKTWRDSGESGRVWGVVRGSVCACGSPPTTLNPDGPIEVTLVAHASIGPRTDRAWATLESPLRINGQVRDRALLGARHQGDSVWSEPVRWPVHVYVCVPEVAAESRNDFTREQVTIAYWGLLHQSREQAEIDY